MSSNRAPSNSLNDRWDLVLLGGMVGSMFSFLQFLVSPFIGTLSDLIGRRTTLLLTMVCYPFKCKSKPLIVYLYTLKYQIGNLVSTALWASASSFNYFLLARIVAGLSEGNVQLSIAIISDVTDEKTRSKGLVSDATMPFIYIYIYIYKCPKAY
jgi:MFS family permease